MANHKSQKWPLPKSENKQTISEHVNELRIRLVRSALVFLVGGAVGYIFRNPLTEIIRKPLHETLYYSSPAGGFNFVMKICFITGLLLALPVLVYNVIGFIQPALKNPLTRKHVRRLALLSGLLAASAVIFVYFNVLPTSLHFFQGFQTSNIKALISTETYLNFVTNAMITFILIFQIPLLMLFIDKIRPTPPRTLLKYERHVIVGSLVIAILLPFTYDPVTQFIIAVPIVVLYNLSILLLWLAHRHPSANTDPINNLIFDVESLLHEELDPQPMPAITRRATSVPIRRAPFFQDVVRRPSTTNHNLLDSPEATL